MHLGCWTGRAFNNPFYKEVNIDAKKIDLCEEIMETGSRLEVEDEITKEEIETRKAGDEEEQEEAEFVKNDAVRKHQTQTSTATLLLPENIERTVKTKLRGNKKKPSRAFFKKAKFWHQHIQIVYVGH